MAGEGERFAAPFFRFVKQTHKPTWVSNASFEAVGGMRLETEVYWRYSQSEEEKKRTIKSRKGRDGNRLTINVFELMGIMMTAYAMIVIRRDRPTKEGESVLMRAMGVLERIGGWSVQAKHVRGVENVLADGITRWKESEIQTS